MAEPPVKIVSSNTDAELARRRALRDAEVALVDLTSNLLRIVRGAGKSYEVGRQAAAVVRAFQAHWDAANMYPSAGEIDEMLSLEREDFIFDRYGEAEAMRILAQRQIIRGALQAAASELVGQRTQQTAGEREMWQGINSVIEGRERRKREQRPLAPNVVIKAKPKPKASTKKR